MGTFSVAFYRDKLNNDWIMMLYFIHIISFKNTCIGTCDEYKCTIIVLHVI